MPDQEPATSDLRILAISGSLRAVSSNTALLHAAALLAPPGVEVSIYAGLGDLPHFNPDLEGSEPPAVIDFLARVRAAGGLLISSPEYAHGVPGAMKNALDWLVSDEEFMGKPVALFNASPYATYAQASLLETLTVMSARVVAAAAIAVPVSGKKLDAAGIVAHPEISSAVRGALEAFVQAIESRDDSAAQGM